MISSIGDALSLVRAERERTVAVPSAELIDQLAAEVRAELIVAGASATAIDVQTRTTSRLCASTRLIQRFTAPPERP